MKTEIVDSPINTSDHLAIEIRMLSSSNNTSKHEELVINNTKAIRIDWHDNNDRNNYYQT